MARFLIITATALVVLVLAVACNDNGDNGGNGDGNGGEETSVATESGPSFTPRPEGTTFDQACQKSGEKEFSGPESVIDPSKTYVATISTSKGNIVLELDSNVPTTTNNFVFLACKGFYDGLTFHRVEAGFVIQGGDPQGTGMGGPGYQIPGEFAGSNFETGVLGMARGPAPDSAGSQFFIMLGPAPTLNGQYASFGHVTEGMDVVQQIAIGDVMNTVTVEER
jgi:cyclophilin family peptidyl-prolyl cis-trans isomerase